jgi:hypothetical protein
MTELLPCSCNGLLPKLLTYGKGDFYIYSLKCNDCGEEIERTLYEVAIEAWNRRTNEPDNN